MAHYILPLFLSGILSLVVAYIYWRQRAILGVDGFLLLTLSGAIWTFFYIPEIIAADLNIKILWANIKSMGMVLSPVAVMFFTLQYTRHRSWLKSFVRTFLWGIVVVFGIIIWTDSLHHTYRIDPTTIVVGGLPFVTFRFGFWYLAQIVYSYLLVLIGVVLILHTMSRVSRGFRKQVIFLVMALLIPWLAFARFFFLDDMNNTIDLTPITLGVSNLIIAWEIFHNRFLSIAPIARNILVEVMTDGIIVIDNHYLVVDINPMAQTITGFDANQAIGRPITRLPGLDGLQFERYTTTCEVSFDHAGRLYHYKLHLSPLQDTKLDLNGWMVIFHDITEIKGETKREREIHQVTEVLLSTGSELNKSLDFNQVIDLILREVKLIVPYDSANFLLVKDDYAYPCRELKYDQHSEEIIQGIGKVNLEIKSTYNLNYMVQTHKSLTISDTYADPNWLRLKGIQPIRSWVGAPIITGDKVIAFLSLDKDEPNFYTDEDAEHLAVFANQAAMALENARLYTEAQQRIVELSILNEIGRTISSYLDINELLKKLHQQIQRVLNADNFLITVYDETTQEWNPIFLIGSNDLNITQRRKASEGLIGYIIRKRAPIIFHNRGEIHAFEELTGVKNLGREAESWMGIPLIAFDKIIGVMAIQHLEQPNLYGEKELGILTTIGATLAIALENARLYNEMHQNAVDLAQSNYAAQEARALSDALRMAGEALGSTLDFDHVLDLILEQIGHLIPNDAANLYLIDGNEAKPIRLGGYEHYGVNLEKQISSTFFKIDETPNIRQIVETKRPLVISDIERYPGWIKGKTFDRIRSWVGAPFIVRDQVVAFLSLIKIEPDYFSPAHAEILEIFAGQAALAMENARLFADVQHFAITDALSGLYNRTYYGEQMRRLDQGRIFPVSIIVGDIDDLKQTNDTLGHAAGDDLIRQTSQLLRSTVRIEDTVARIGGDEFAILLPNTDAEKAKQILNRFREKLSVFNKEHLHTPLNISLGLSTGNQDRSLSDVFREADNRMYAEKKKHKKKNRKLNTTNMI